MVELTVIRTEFGFRRTSCDCPLCSSFCRVCPGPLVPADLARLCPPDTDVFEWARQNLRARRGGYVIRGKLKLVPALVPKDDGNGRCHWLEDDGRCAVHDQSPYGCAFFDQHSATRSATK